MQPPPPTPPLLPPGVCLLPDNIFAYSLITKDDADLGAHTVTKGLAIGGALQDSSPFAAGAATVGGRSYVGSIRGIAQFNWRGGIRYGQGIPFSFMQLEELALSVVPLDNSVLLVDQGGRYSSTDEACDHPYRPPASAAAEDNGNTLIVFKGEGTICLASDHYGKEFGPSVLAPFARVVIHHTVG